MTKKAALIILDGWGIGDGTSSDAISNAHTPFTDSLYDQYPHAELLTDGENVGLPTGQMGNSEVGHMNIGAGRVVDQEIVRINKGIATGSVKDSASLKAAIANVKEKGTALHLMGLISDAGVHAMLEHVYGLIRIAKEEGVKELYLHAFTDGRDTGPFSGKQFIKQAEAEMATIGLGKIASLSGRYWAMDRDNRWDRVQRAYDCLTGRNIESTATSAEAGIQYQYDNPETQGTKGDEFCPPTAILDAEGQPVATIAEGDSVIFCNFRGDRPRELTRAFIEDGFDGFDRGPKLDIYFATLSEYQKGLCDHIIFFKPEKMEDILGGYLADRGIPQFRCAETEKFPHVTFFFNDYREEPFPGEDRALISSRKDCATYDEKPYNLEINKKIEAIAKANNIKLHIGVYASVVGPQLETRAEYRILKIIGSDAVGMSTVPEVIVANHLNLKVAAISVKRSPNFSTPLKANGELPCKLI